MNRLGTGPARKPEPERSGAAVNRTEYSFAGADRPLGSQRTS